MYAAYTQHVARLAVYNRKPATDPLQLVVRLVTNPQQVEV